MAKNDKSTENKRFFKDFKAEIKKVVWPTPKQLVNTTIAIITMVIIVAVIVFVLDVVFDGFNKYALTNLQEVVQRDNNNNSNEDSANQETTNTEDVSAGEATTETTETTETETTEGNQ